MKRFVRVASKGGPRVGRLLDGQIEVLDHDEPLRAIAGVGAVAYRMDVTDARLLAPIHAPEVWCAGVTYERSRDARLEESQEGVADAYALVYDAPRPELFFKDAQMRRTVGPGCTIRTRSDSRWNVPEPELAIVLGERLEPIAMTIGNDVSSRDIEGENPLYLPQAKIFAAACAIGPALAVPTDWAAPLEIALRIEQDDGTVIFEASTSTADMRRTLPELVEWLVRSNPVPPGSVLLTGTGLIPPDNFSLQPGQIVQIEIEGIGALRNPVGPAT